MPSGKARMPPMTATLGLISASVRRLERSHARRLSIRGPGSRSGAETATPIEPAPLCLACELAAAVEDRRDPSTGGCGRVRDLLLPGAYLDEHVGKHVCVLDVGPVLRGGHELAVLGRVVDDRVEAGAQADHRGRGWK